jgi:hypothetical protein
MIWQMMEPVVYVRYKLVYDVTVDDMNSLYIKRIILNN